jgi:hypothetical protein
MRDGTPNPEFPTPAEGERRLEDRSEEELLRSGVYTSKQVAKDLEKYCGIRVNPVTGAFEQVGPPFEGAESTAEVAADGSQPAGGTHPSQASEGASATAPGAESKEAGVAQAVHEKNQAAGQEGLGGSGSGAVNNVSGALPNAATPTFSYKEFHEQMREIAWRKKRKWSFL